MRRAWLLLLLVVAGTAASGCVGVTSDDSPAGSVCFSPMRSGRYALCGHVSTVGIASPSDGVWVIGAVDSTQRPMTGRYTISGGTFHAYR
jgi:hypothetical protein